MEHNLARERQTRQDNPIGALAVDLLAYAAVGDEEALQRRTLEASGADLGRAILTWYHMCEAHTGVDSVAGLARQTAQKLQASMDKTMESLDPQSQYVKDQCVGLSMARGLLIDLATDQMDRFTELWASVITNYSVPVILETVALMLGFTRGVLDNQTAQS